MRELRMEIASLRNKDLKIGWRRAPELETYEGKNEYEPSAN